MNEAHVTVVGRAATPVDYRMSATGIPMARFRLASTVRRFDRGQGGWVDGPTSFYTVWARRALARNLASSVAVGEPVIVQGSLRVHEGEWEGRRFLSADLAATAVGHDLTRGTSAFVRAEVPVPRPPGEPESGGVGEPVGAPAEERAP